MDDLNEVRKVSEAAYRFLSRIKPKDCQDGHYEHKTKRLPGWPL